MRVSTVAITFLGFVLGLGAGAGADEAQVATREQAEAALKKAVTFYRTTVARHHGYLWEYSGDLTLAEGEGKVDGNSTVWVQPPGTPTVGLAYLTAYEATGDTAYLDAARETAHALVQGQLLSGGWTYSIEFEPADRRKFAYRVEKRQGGKNFTTLDDDTSQEALRLVMRVDRALEFKDAVLHECAEFALASLLKAQYPNGSWAQGFERPPDPAQHPVVRANYPGGWPKTPTRKDYWSLYTLNDNSLRNTVDVLLLAARVYGDERYRAAAARAGDFLILAQMPAPQPAWAQQYDFDMHPTWARKFEPPAISGGESQGAMEVLMTLYRETADRKYLEPIPRALAYLNKSLLPDRRLARFYELESNKPLYFTKDYELTHSDDDVPTHYAFKVPSRLDAIAAEYRRLADGRDGTAFERAGDLERLGAEARAAIDTMDERGAWVEKGALRFHKAEPESGVIRSRTFVKNVEALSRYIAAKR